jgi:hypothetical protein
MIGHSRAMMLPRNLFPSARIARVKILWLVCIHMLLGLLLAATRVLVGSRLSLDYVFTGLLLSQASLLGIWGGSGTNPWWIRFVGALAGVSYVGFVFGILLHQLGGYVFLYVAFTMVEISMGLLVVRCFGLHIRADPDRDVPKIRTQFYISHLMILIVAVACFLAVVREMRPSLTFGGLPFYAGVGLPFAIVGVVAVWAVLGTKHIFMGSIALLPVAVGSGFILAWSIPFAIVRAVWIPVILTEALLLTFSLLVVRSSGYRLRRQASPAQMRGGG